MPITNVQSLLTELRQYHLLDAKQLEELTRKVQGKNIPPRALAQKLIEQGWLTAFQVNQLLQGQGQQLQLGAYVLLERLGEGGMGAVYKARNKMGSVVAIKVMKKERMANANAVLRFQREIRAAAKLNHPNIVKAIDAGEAGGTQLFVMEHVEGTDLSKLVKEKGPLPVDQACDCIRQAALGLQHAHETGMVHRDIKPHNLLLTRTGKGPPVVKLLDMGLARVANEDTTITQEGSVVGTMDYLAPEQARNSHTVDIRGDLYALGCTFHYLLTGQVPFPGGTAAEKMFKHQFDEPALVTQLRPEVPAGVAEVVRKLMAKKPEDRFQTPAELAAALANGVTATAVQRQSPRQQDMQTETIADPNAPPARKKSRLLLGLVGGGIFVGLVGLVLTWLVRSDPSAKKDPEKNFTNSIGMKLVLIPAGEFTMGSPDTESQRETGRNFAPEGPQHRVRISRSFYMGAYEVKQREYEKLSKNQSSFKDPDNPAENVTWAEAMDFCKKLSELPDEKKASRVYRLPLEAEWEYACRAGTTTVFHFGNSLSSKQANFDGTNPYGGPDQGANIGRTVKCGSYGKNVWGLYDMHGNVWEWCLDGPRDYPKEPLKEPLVDPRGPEIAGGSRVLRGGAWNAGGFECRSARRHPDQPSFRHGTVGFRVVCELPRETSAAGSKAEVDLLKLIDPKVDSIQGAWRLEGGALVSPKGNGDRIQIRHEPPEEYTLALTVEPGGGGHLLSIGLVHLDSQFSFVTMSGPEGNMSALEVLDGKAGNKPENASMYRGVVLESGKPSSISCIVRKAGVTITCDRRPILNWRGDYRRLTPQSGPWVMPNKRFLYIGTWDSTVRITKIVLTPL